MIPFSDVISGVGYLLRQLLPAYAVGFTLFLILALTPDEKATLKQFFSRRRRQIIGVLIGVVVLYILQATVLPRGNQPLVMTLKLPDQLVSFLSLTESPVWSLDLTGIYRLLYYIIRIFSAIAFRWIAPNILFLYAFAITLVFICLRRPQYNDMLKYISKRMVTFIPTLLIISFVIYFVIQLPPGDYVDSYVGALAAEGEIFTVEQIEDLRVQFGLNDPWYVQYVDWIDGIIVDGYFGYSFEYGREVWSVIMDRLYLTLGVSFIILVFQYGVSLPVGIYCANHQYSPGDYIFSFVGFIGTATPNFLLAIIIMYYIYVSTGEMYLGLFSLEMQQAGGFSGLTWATIPEFLGRCAIPLIVIGTSGTCGIIRTVRAQMLDEQARQYTLTARAKGCSEFTITYKYCLRAALNPVVSGLAGSLRTIFSGSTVSAIVMNLAIQGPVLLTALKSQDMYLAGTIVLVQAVLVLVGTLLSDIALAWLDPRIRFSERS